MSFMNKFQGSPEVHSYQIRKIGASNIPKQFNVLHGDEKQNCDEDLIIALN